MGTSHLAFRAVPLRLLVMRDLEIGEASASVRRSHKHLGRNTRWVGLCVEVRETYTYIFFLGVVLCRGFGSSLWGRELRDQAHIQNNIAKRA